MIPRNVGGNIRIAAQPRLGLQTGETVSLHILKRLDGNKWAVGIQGRVFPARTNLDLRAGTTIQARVDYHAGHIVLAVVEGHEQAAGSVLPGQRVIGDLAGLIAASLLRAGRPVTEEIVSRMKAVIERSKLPKERAARSLAALNDKGIDTFGPGAEKLVEAFAFGEKEGGSYRGYKKKKLPRDAGAVGEFVKALPADAEIEPGPLAVFNHLRARSQSWVVLPFLFAEEGEEYPGTLKILYDPFLHRPRVVSLTVTPHGGSSVSFHLILEGKKRMSLFVGDPLFRAAAQRNLEELTAKFRNLGIEVDDIIHGEEDFDGFSPMGEGTLMRNVDTVG
jgi:hypothetical protein